METQSGSILVVDDEFSVRDSLYHWFRKDGFQVIAAANATEALKAMQEHPFDVVFLDIKMPGMDGIETLKRIKVAHPTTEVIMLTGHASFDSAIDGMKLGAFDYLLKPVAIDDLTAKVEEAKNKRRQHQAKIFEAVGKQIRERIAR